MFTTMLIVPQFTGYSNSKIARFQSDSKTSVAWKNTKYNNGKGEITTVIQLLLYARDGVQGAGQQNGLYLVWRELDAGSR